LGDAVKAASLCALVLAGAGANCAVEVVTRRCGARFLPAGGAMMFVMRILNARSTPVPFHGRNLADGDFGTGARARANGRDDPDHPEWVSAHRLIDNVNEPDVLGRSINGAVLSSNVVMRC